MNDQLVAQQKLYGDLINWRGNKVDNRNHKAKVLSGYFKIMSLVNRKSR